MVHLIRGTPRWGGDDPGDDDAGKAETKHSQMQPAAPTFGHLGKGSVPTVGRRQRLGVCFDVTGGLRAVARECINVLERLGAGRHDRGTPRSELAW
jgi:hypothetical protein